MASLVAGGQWGVIGHQQLLDVGFTLSAVKRGLADGRLYQRHPGVYTLGHRWVPIEGQMVAAILHAGAGTALSHATAAWWWRLVLTEPTVIDVSTPTRARSTQGVRVHHPRQIDATTHRRFPITSVARTLVDYASKSPLRDVRQVLAEADYRGLLHLDALTPYLTRGRPGSRCLRRALERHQPKLAFTRSEVERRFFELCEEADVPVPEVNAPVSLMRIDIVWPDFGLAVELDGYAGHHTPAQMERDRRRELHARMHGLIVIRYTWRQVMYEPALVEADLRRQFSLIARSA